MLMTLLLGILRSELIAPALRSDRTAKEHLPILSQALKDFSSEPTAKTAKAAMGWALEIKNWLASTPALIPNEPAFSNICHLIEVYGVLVNARGSQQLLLWFQMALEATPRRYDVLNSLVIKTEGAETCSLPTSKIIALRTLCELVKPSTVNPMDVLIHFSSTSSDPAIIRAFELLCSEKCLIPQHLPLLAMTTRSGEGATATLAIKHLTQNFIKFAPHASLHQIPGGTHFFNEFCTRFHEEMGFDRGILDRFINFQRHPKFTVFLNDLLLSVNKESYLFGVNSFLQTKLLDNELFDQLKSAPCPRSWGGILQALDNEGMDREQITCFANKLLKNGTQAKLEAAARTVYFLSKQRGRLVTQELDHVLEAPNAFYLLWQENSRKKLPTDDPAFFKNLVTLESTGDDSIQGYIDAENEQAIGRSFSTYHLNWPLALAARLNRDSSITTQREANSERLLRAYPHCHHTTTWLRAMLTLDQEGVGHSFRLLIDCFSSLPCTAKSAAKVQIGFLNELQALAAIYPLPTVISYQTGYAPLNEHFAFMLFSRHPKLNPRRQEDNLYAIQGEWATYLAEQPNLIHLLERVSTGEIEPEWGEFVSRLQKTSLYKDTDFDTYKTRIGTDEACRRIMPAIISGLTHVQKMRQMMGVSIKMLEVIQPPALQPAPPPVVWPSKVALIRQAQPILWDDESPPPDNPHAMSLHALINASREMGFRGDISGKVMADSIKVLECLLFISMNKVFLDYAHMHQYSTDPIILGSIFSSDKDRLKHHVIRDPYNYTSIHIYQSAKIAEESGHLFDSAVLYIATLQDAIHDLVAASKGMSTKQLTLFFYKFTYENDIGCIDARISTALKYAIELKETEGIDSIDNVMASFVVESNRRNLKDTEADDNAYPVLYAIAKPFLEDATFQVMIDGVPTPFTEALFKSYCKETLSYEVDSPVAMASAIQPPKGISSLRTLLAQFSNDLIFSSQDEACLFAEFVAFYHRCKGAISVKPFVRNIEGGYVVESERYIPHGNAVTESLRDFGRTGITPERRPVDRLSDHGNEPLMYYLKNYRAKPLSHQNLLVHLWTLERFATCGVPSMEIKALFELMLTYPHAIASPELHIHSGSAETYVQVLQSRFDFAARYPMEDADYTVLEYAITRHEDLARLLIKHGADTTQRTAEGLTLRQHAASHNCHQITAQLSRQNPFLPKVLTAEQVNALPALKDAASKFYTKKTDTRVQIQNMVSAYGFTSFESFQAVKPTPFLERTWQKDDLFWTDIESWDFSLYCQYLCDAINRYPSADITWAAPNAFWQNLVTISASKSNHAALSVLVEWFGLATFESQKKECYHKAYVTEMLHILAKDVANHSYTPAELTARLSMVKRLINPLKESDEELEKVASVLNLPTPKAYSSWPTAQSSALDEYCHRLQEANDNYAQVVPKNDAESAEIMTASSIIRSTRAPGFHTYSPLLQFFRDSAMVVNDRTTNDCLAGFLRHKNKREGQQQPADRAYQQLISEIREIQRPRIEHAKMALRALILDKYPEHNPEDMMIRLSELILHGVTVTAFISELFNTEDCAIPLLGLASFAHTAPYTENNNARRIQSLRDRYEKALIRRISPDLVMPCQGLTYAHQIPLACKINRSAGFELVSVGDERYGPNTVIHSTHTPEDRILVVGNIVEDRQKDLRPMVIDSRESTFLLLASFPNPMIIAYLHLVNHGAFPENVLTSENTHKDPLKHDITITSLGGPAQLIEQKRFSTVLFSDSLPVSAEAKIALGLAHDVSVESATPGVLNARFIEMLRAIDADNADLVALLLRTYPFFAQAIPPTEAGLLGYAIRTQKLKSAETLLSLGAHPYFSDPQGDTALHLAMRLPPSKCKHKLVENMIKRAADKDILLLQNNAHQCALTLGELDESILLALTAKPPKGYPKKYHTSFQEAMEALGLLRITSADEDTMMASDTRGRHEEVKSAHSGFFSNKREHTLITEGSSVVMDPKKRRVDGAPRG
ncbi:MAG: ankyrin repeat domain-containing protein [Legionellales bacterium]|nr:ankyrin repeat domain-containing protein [Legionellales bacterium]